MPLDRQAAVFQGLFQAPVAAFGQVQFPWLHQRLPALQLTRYRAGVLRVIKGDVLHPNTALLQRFGKVAHCAEDQDDFLRMVGYMAGFLHDLDHQDGIVLAVQPGQ